jgi:DNA end-binding protein Ku
MSARALWKTRIRFGRVIVPVKLYSAVEDRNLHFRLLHRKDLLPVEQHMIHPRTGKPVPSNEIRRGYETEEGDIILLEEEDLQSFQVEDSPSIDISGFIDLALISPPWYDRPYYLEPDGDSRRYFALAGALEKENKVGLARWNMRRKSYSGVIRARNGTLMIMTLRFAREVIELSAIPRTEGRALEKPELQMAEQLVHALEGDFDPLAFEDKYRNRVLALVERKARGEKVVLHKPRERKPESASLAEILKKSLLQVEKERKIA